MSWHGFVKPNTCARANRERWDTHKTQTYAGEQLEDKTLLETNGSLDAQNYLTGEEMLRGGRLETIG